MALKAPAETPDLVEIQELTERLAKLDHLVQWDPVV